MVTHPQLRLAVMVTALHAPYARLPDVLLRALLLGFVAANAASPAALALLLRRLCFYTGPEPPPFAPDASVTYVRLTQSNYHDVLRATTCIPFVSERCTYIEGVGHGYFCDGALSDYYLGMRPASPSHPLLLLGDRPSVKKTAFDLFVPWRNADAAFLTDCCVLHPNAAFARALPAGRYPDTFDWFDRAYVAAPGLRQWHWRAAFDLSAACFPACVGRLAPHTGGWAEAAAGAGGAGAGGLTSACQLQQALPSEEHEGATGRGADEPAAAA